MLNTKRHPSPLPMRRIQILLGHYRCPRQISAAVRDHRLIPAPRSLAILPTLQTLKLILPRCQETALVVHKRFRLQPSVENLSLRMLTRLLWPTTTPQQPVQVHPLSIKEGGAKIRDNFTKLYEYMNILSDCQSA